jgi:hypothetical protein
MIAKKRTLIAGLAVCAVALATLGNASKPIQRPLTVKATAVWVVSLGDGSATCIQEGEATHLGHFTAMGTGTWDLGNFLVVSGGGTVTAANGDFINWTVGKNNSVILPGGIGRFSLANGGFSTKIVGEPLIVPGPVAVSVTVQYVGTGTLQY